MGNILICGDRLLAGDSIHKKTIPFEDGFIENEIINLV